MIEPDYNSDTCRSCDGNPDKGCYDCHYCDIRAEWLLTHDSEEE